MILTERDKSFIIKNKDSLQSLFQRRIDEMKDEMVNEEDEEKTKSKKLLIREFVVWLKDLEILANPKPKPKRNLI